MIDRLIRSGNRAGHLLRQIRFHERNIPRHIGRREKVFRAGAILHVSQERLIERRRVASVEQRIEIVGLGT